jgi:hypothetical protein
MKLTVLNWFKEASIAFIGRVIELIFRLILFFLPLGVYLLLIQAREKASSVSNISIYTSDESRWQHIFPGFLLVTIDHNSFRKSFNKVKSNIQSWVSSNKYLIEILFMVLLLAIMITSEVLR